MKDYAKVEKWMDPEEKVFRQGFDGLIQTVNKQHLLPKPICNYQVFEDGTSSTVALVKTEDNQSFVFKTALNSENIVREAVTLNHWRQTVTTPEINYLHEPTGNLPVAFLTAEYISSPSLDAIPTDQRIDRGISFELGKELALIHQLPLPENASLFPVYSLQKIAKKSHQHLESLAQNGVLKPEHVNIVLQSLAFISSSSDKTLTLCHNDFMPDNILFRDDHELVIFDPNPTITHPLSDLAHTLVRSVVDDPNFGQQEAQEILKGYESITEIDYDLLLALFNVQCVKKITRWQLKENQEKMSRTIALIENPPAFLRKNK